MQSRFNSVQVVLKHAMPSSLNRVLSNTQQVYSFNPQTSDTFCALVFAFLDTQAFGLALQCTRDYNPCPSPTRALRPCHW